MNDIGRSLYEREVARRLLALREDLVRFDENWAAWQLLDQCVPYFLRDHPEIIQAKADQREMVLHLLEPEEMRRYYAENPHERPFEEQYGMLVERAHLIPRIGFLRLALQRIHHELKRDLRVLDLGANDGFMAANIGALGFVTTDCVDLHPGNCEIARRRRKEGAAIGEVICGDVVDTESWPASAGAVRESYDAVVAFELIEHVASPDELLDTLRYCAAPGGRLFVSTPDGAVEQGDLPNWDHVERKGHVRSLRAQDLRELCEQVGRIEDFNVGADRVAVAQVRPR